MGRCPASYTWSHGQLLALAVLSVVWVLDLKPLQQQRPFQILPLFHTRHSASKLRFLLQLL
jgi:hypothetical protein